MERIGDGRSDKDFAGRSPKGQGSIRMDDPVLVGPRRNDASLSFLRRSQENLRLLGVVLVDRSLERTFEELFVVFLARIEEIKDDEGGLSSFEKGGNFFFFRLQRSHFFLSFSTPTRINQERESDGRLPTSFFLLPLSRRENESSTCKQQPGFTTHQNGRQQLQLQQARSRCFLRGRRPNAPQEAPAEQRRAGAQARRAPSRRGRGKIPCSFSAEHFAQER